MLAEKAKLQEELFARIKPGDVVDGVVKNITDFGAFIDLGGVDVCCISLRCPWGRVDNPKKLFKVG